MNHEVYVAVRHAEIDGDMFNVGDRVSGDCPHIQTHPAVFERLDRYEARQLVRSLANDPARGGRSAYSCLLGT